MPTTFIPSFHFVNPAKKLTKEWCWDAVTWCWYNTNNHNLLENKDVLEIEQYATGEFDMTPFKRMFKSQAKALDKQTANGNNVRDINGFQVRNEIGYFPLPLIPIKLNSAWATVQKIPIEVNATAQDPLAAKKKNEDLTFLKNKPSIEAQLQPLSDKLGLGQVDLGTTKYSAQPFSDSPYGLDLTEPDELQVFVDLIYNLAVESSFETALQEFWEIKDGKQIKSLEIKDHLYYGVSAHRSFTSSITGLPDFEYIFPGDVSVPFSRLPDYSDNPHRFIHHRATPMELFNYFGNEICNEETLKNIINDSKLGYCACNNISTVPYNNFNSFKVNLIYCEIKSVDSASIAPINKKSKYSTLNVDNEDATCTDKIWGQNTYGFWWLQNTKFFFDIHRLDFSYREKGRESYQNFSTNIYRSQKKSAVECSISENKKAQIADIKMQHAIIKSLPPGRYIDLRFMRNALTGLAEGAAKYTQDDLINLAMEQNFFIGDTDGFDGKNDGQFKPFMDIPGGIKTEVVGYMQVIADASQKIGQFTGINEQMTGQSANPDGLIGLQKLLINQSINALYYINEAIVSQYTKLFSNWASIIQAAVQKGGKTKEAIVNIVGAKKVSLIAALDDLPLHNFGIHFSLTQKEEERQKNNDNIAFLKQQGVLTVVDEYMLSGITDPKDKMGLIAARYKRWEKKQDAIRAEAAQNQQAMIQQQGQNILQATQAKTQGNIQEKYAQGDVNSKILQLASQLGIQSSQMEGMIKKALQQDRGADQIEKSLKTMEAKAELENQKPLQ